MSYRTEVGVAFASAGALRGRKHTSAGPQLPRTLSPTCSVRASRPRAVVVGAGPTGALAALYLQRGGYDVTVFDKRPAPSKPSEVASRCSRRPYSIVLNERGLSTLDAFDNLAERVRAAAVLIAGSCGHYPATGGGKWRTVMGGPFAGSLSILRDDLVSCLIDYGRKLDVLYRLDESVTDIDLRKRTLSVSGSNQSGGDPEVSEFDLCVLAEGVYGRLRNVAKRVGGFTLAQKEDNMEFKLVQLPKIGSFYAPPPKTDAGSNLRLFRTFPGSAPGCSVLAPPRLDELVHAIMLTTRGGYQKYFQDAAAVKASFFNFFPFVYGPSGPPESVVEEILSQPVSIGGVTTVCNKFDACGCCVLVGDCAHSCWPSLGQSANCGMESVSVLADTLFSATNDESSMRPEAPVGDDLAARLNHYSEHRKPDTDAVGRLSERGFGQNSRVLTKRALARIAVMLALSKLVPVGTFFKPALFDLGNPAMPYSVILRKQLAQDAVASAILISCMVAMFLLAIPWVL